VQPVLVSWTLASMVADTWGEGFESAGGLAPALGRAAARNNATQKTIEQPTQQISRIVMVKQAALDMP
jgi:hypothetical protein